MSPGQGEKVAFRCVTTDRWPLAVVGSVPELGSWNIEHAIAMQPQDSMHTDRKEWTVHATLQHGQTLEYKFVKLTDHGSIWEAGDNRRLTVIPGAHTITDDYRE